MSKDPESQPIGNRRRISRHDFMKGAGLAGVGLLAGCVPAAVQPPAAPPAGAPVAPAAPSAAGGKKSVLVMGMSEELEFLNVLYTQGGNSLSASKMAQRGLLFLDKDSNWIGEIASDVPSIKAGTITPDGSKITYKLRQGLTWHDGKPVTSADVKATWEMIMDSKNAVITRFGYNKIGSVDTPDDNTVVLNFKEPFASWPILFDAIVPKHVIEANKANLDKSEAMRMPIGCGPFKLVSYKQGETVEYEAFDKYFRGRPKIDRFIIKFYPNVEACFQAVQAKEVDLAWSLPSSYVPKIRDLEPQGIKMVTTKIAGSDRYVMNADAKQAPLFADKTLRQALQYAVDKMTMIDKLMFGLTVPATSEWSGSPWENPKLAAYNYDPAKAKQMLDSLGWKPGADGVRAREGKRLSFVNTTYTNDQLVENMQLLVQQQFKDIGVETVIQNKRSTELFGGWTQNGVWSHGDYQMGGWAHSIRVPDPEVSNRYLCSEIASDQNQAGSQWYRYCSPKVDELLSAQSKEFDPDKRKDLIFKAQELINDDAYIIFLDQRVSIYTARAEVKNFVLHPFANFYWNPQEWEWA